MSQNDTETDEVYQTFRVDGDGKQLQIAEWSERPYTSHDRRRAVVDHRVLMDVYPDGNVDVRHQVRSTHEKAAQSEDWESITVWEVRDHGVQKLKAGAVIRQ